MGISVDGRILPRRWKLAEGDISAMTNDYEALHEELAGDAWLIGRVTMAEFARGEPKTGLSTAGIDRSNHIVTRTAKGYAIGIDSRGKMHFHTDTANGNHLVTVLSELVSDEYLAELRASGISYVFAGKTEVDLPLALETLARELPIKRLLLEGGGLINGAFLKAGLIDELSLLVAPAVDGLEGSRALFDFPGDPDDPPVDVTLKLQSVERREGDYVWLRYTLKFGA
jgi:5-amino-6-(5-phosphoribosylamino)uracil reductase